MKILVINTGSSSLKYQLFNMDDTTVMAGGVVERIGEDSGVWAHTIFARGREEKIIQERTFRDHKTAMHSIVGLIVDSEKGIIDDVAQINAVGHRVVQGGEAFKSAVIIDESVKDAIRENNRLAPLHNPSNLTGIEVSEALLPGITNVAVFDTEFHQTMPPRAFRYPLPNAFYTRFKVRKYGFHGTSHKYIAHQAAGLIKKDIETVNLITVHLGNGCSISAIEKGRCIDTSMGMTPLAGLMMGTRTGDMDPAVIGYLLEQTGMQISELEAVLNKESGLKGICGINDMRDIHDAAANGDSNAALALDMFCYRVKKYIGAYTAALGRVDAVVLSAGVGENDAVVREKVCENLSSLGIRIDTEKNGSSRSKPFSFHSADSPVAVWVIPTNEELQIANEVYRIVKPM